MTELFRCRCYQCGMTGITDDVIPYCPNCHIVMELTEKVVD